MRRRIRLGRLGVRRGMGRNAAWSLGLRDLFEHEKSVILHRAGENLIGGPTHGCSEP